MQESWIMLIIIDNNITMSYSEWGTLSTFLTLFVLPLVLLSNFIVQELRVQDNILSLF